MNFTGGFEFLYLNLFDLYLLIVIARFVLQIGRGDFYNPLSQFIFKATSPLLTPLRRVIPAFGRTDTASIVLFLALVIIKLVFWILLFSRGGFGSQFGILVLLSALGTVINFFLVVIFATVILSWISSPYHPIAGVIRSMAEPLLGPVRRLIPPIGMLDLSAMIVLLFLFFIRTSFNLQVIP
ncbi:YggT family protein [Aurantivibrio infirmus]